MGLDALVVDSCDFWGVGLISKAVSIRRVLRSAGRAIFCVLFFDLSRRSAGCACARLLLALAGLELGPTNSVGERHISTCVGSGFGCAVCLSDWGQLAVSPPELSLICAGYHSAQFQLLYRHGKSVHGTAPAFDVGVSGVHRRVAGGARAPSSHVVAGGKSAAIVLDGGAVRLSRLGSVRQK